MDWDKFQDRLLACFETLERDLKDGELTERDKLVVGRTIQGVILAIHNAVRDGAQNTRH